MSSPTGCSYHTLASDSALRCTHDRFLHPHASIYTFTSTMKADDAPVTDDAAVQMSNVEQKTSEGGGGGGTNRWCQ